MIDAHCHLYEAEDIEAELARFKAAGGEALVCAGAGMESSKRAIELARKYLQVWATVGMLPESREKAGKIELVKLAQEAKVVAIGECGLDYPEGVGDEEKERQRELLEMNVEVARETKLPLVVHCRNAFEDVWELVKDTGVVGQMHCWTGNGVWMRKFAEAGWYISFGGILTFKNSRDLREVARKVPEDRLLVETDAPYLAPEPVRGSKNEPQNVKYVIAGLAQVRGIAGEKISRITADNARRVFGRMR